MRHVIQKRIGIRKELNRAETYLRVESSFQTYCKICTQSQFLWWLQGAKDLISNLRTPRGSSLRYYERLAVLWFWIQYWVVRMLLLRKVMPETCCMHLTIWVCNQVQLERALKKHGWSFCSLFWDTAFDKSDEGFEVCSWQQTLNNLA